MKALEERGLKGVASNKLGNILGRKGRESHQRLMDAAKALLRLDHSPFNLTAAAIAKKAGMAGATFYVYFSDVEDILYSICEETIADMAEITVGPEAFSDPDRLLDDAETFIDSFNEVWDRHADILLYRNLEADRGNERFRELRHVSALPILDLLGEVIMRAYGPDVKASRSDAYADAVILHSAIERSAVTRYQYRKPGLSHARLRNAQVRILARELGPRTSF